MHAEEEHQYEKVSNTDDGHGGDGDDDVVERHQQREQQSHIGGDVDVGSPQVVDDDGQPDGVDVGDGGGDVDLEH